MDELAQRLELALAQSKKVQRESRYLTQMLAGVRDLQALRQKENPHARPEENSE